ncbi:protein-S-isoprenylcysteine O-methyltransferase Ste14 [Bradyrhizobium sp. USDA 4353]
MSKLRQIAARARRRLRNCGFTQQHALYVGQALFVLGWSLVWANGLALVTFVPIGTGPILMAAGLTCLSVRRRARPARPPAPTLIPRPMPPC